MDAAGEDRAAAVDADDRQLLWLVVALHDLVGDPDEGATHVVLVEDDLLMVHRVFRSFLASRDRVKELGAALKPSGPSGRKVVS